ncbi:hypothetical protein GCM10007423_51030 [Dyadobacter endophyticus]|uniref:Uncharacterized protein n=1 Tax=Dyadobacter endophyticus TaxID=1749036 RepID=A0ABQ1Z6E5_9BACT|nr:hypothetical protein GCM10007423_51030 [Dyadobacter endophyticus]
MRREFRFGQHVAPAFGNVFVWEGDQPRPGDFMAMGKQARAHAERRADVPEKRRYYK